jgi:isoleucyl-tRNA synthetase
MFLSVPNHVDFPSLERDVLQRWKEDRTFETSVTARAGSPTYVFYDGPPFATGLPHYGHILTSYVKDIVPRYFTMRGFHVPRRWGWDCHGLPVEFEVEKELGFRSKSDILQFGIDRFNTRCRSIVLKYAAEWRSIITRLGRWVDFENDYKTMDPKYMESVVWVFKKLWERGLVYEGQKVVAFCTRCQTPLSNFEARQDDAFRERIDPAIVVRFRFAEDPSQSLLAWTTTPWTLPSNVALAVNRELEYVRLGNGKETLWLARTAIPRFAGELKEYREVSATQGRMLEGVRYRPLFPYFVDTPNAFQVLAGEFVLTGEGTGIVHLAPSFGEEDAALCQAHEIEGPNPVRDDGTFNSQVIDYAGRHVLDANHEIVSHLQRSGMLLGDEQKYRHNYPHCWRCDSPLIYRSIVTWFVNVNEIKSAIVEANKRINWVPEHIRDGRFGSWLENARDWAVSRSRFWGAPVPVWRCERCQDIAVVGSREELLEVSGFAAEDWHRPAIDEVTWECGCGGTLKRVPDILDCWFESGAMPYAQMHYPFENRTEFEKSFPGDFIVEYIAQTRGWFYTLVVLAAALFNERPFKNAICHGVILSNDGRKMSKRLKNYPDPLELVETYGSDALRIALMQSAALRGVDMRFSGKAATFEAVRRFCIPLWNCLHFFTAYASIDGFEPSGRIEAPTCLDRYLLSETDRLRETIEEHMAAYDVAGCYDAIESYIVILSTWYIRLSRDRFWGSEGPEGKSTAFETLYAALSNVALILAPFLPFLSESFHQALGGRRSVHLEDWPASRSDWRDHRLSTEMADVRTVVRLARGIRDAHRISHRQPLKMAAIANLAIETIDLNRDILLRELNVKEIRTLDRLDGHVKLIVKLNNARVGKRLRSETGKVAAAIDAGTYSLASDHTKLFVLNHELDRQDFTLQYAPATERTDVAAEGKLVVVIDLVIDATLVAELYARVVNRGLQDLRKEAGLRYEDRIVIAILGSASVRNAVLQHRDWLAEQTLAVDISFEPLASPEARKEIRVDKEHSAELMLARVDSTGPKCDKLAR